MRRLLLISPFLLAMFAACSKAPSKHEAERVASFSTSSASDTLAWVAAKRVSTVEAAPKGNDLAIGTAQKRNAEEVEPVAKGQSVRWAMRVESIAASGMCIISPVSLDGGRDPHTGSPRQFALRVLADTKPEFGLNPPDHDWLMRLSPGDTVIIAGRVTKVILQRSSDLSRNITDSAFFDLERGHIEKP